MITLDNFTTEIKKYNSVKYLNNIIKKVNNGEGYISLLGSHVLFNKYLNGAAKRDRDEFIENSMKGIVSFDL
jgi:hypothetical protein